VDDPLAAGCLLLTHVLTADALHAPPEIVSGFPPTLKEEELLSVKG